MAKTTYTAKGVSEILHGVGQTRSLSELSVTADGLLNGGGVYGTYTHGYKTAEADWFSYLDYGSIILTTHGMNPSEGVFLDMNTSSYDLDTDGDSTTYQTLKSETYHTTARNLITTRVAIRSNGDIKFAVHDGYRARIPLELLKDVCRFYSKVGEAPYGEKSFLADGNLVPASVITAMGGDADFVFDCDDYSGSLIGMFYQRGLGHYAVFKTTMGNGTHSAILAFCTDGKTYIVEPQGVNEADDTKWIRDYDEWYAESGGVGGVATKPSGLNYYVEHFSR